VECGKCNGMSLIMQVVTDGEDVLVQGLGFGVFGIQQFLRTEGQPLDNSNFIPYSKGNSLEFLSSTTFNFFVM
jgi:hypothetical protein